MGQTPPPWHGQAVATQILFEHDWPGMEVHRLRMEFSEEMVEVGRFQWRKIGHLIHLIREARRILKRHPDCVLFYPPASAKWIPFIRDVIFLCFTRQLAGSTVFIFHASGLPVFCQKVFLRRMLSMLAYHHADVALEVAKEPVPAHEIFHARNWQWCPCAIEVPQRMRGPHAAGSPLKVLFVGSLQEGKGVLEILRTASILKKQGKSDDFRFRIVGKWFSDEFENAVRHIREELELEGMVELTGQLTGDAKWDAYFSADVFFFPTHYESEATPIVLMEALGAGLPILSTQWAGIPAMLEGCASATLLPIKSPTQYAAALVVLKSKIDGAYAPAVESRQFYQDRFLPMRFIERVEKAFLLAAGEVTPFSDAVSPSMDTKADVVSAHDMAGTVAAAHDRCTKHLDDPSMTVMDLHDTGSDPSASSFMDRCYKPEGDLFAPTVIDRRYKQADELAATHTSSAPGHSVLPVPSTIHDPRSKVFISVYLADQNPGHDRSFGISRMSRVVLGALIRSGKVTVEAVVSRSSQQPPPGCDAIHTLPWSTRGKISRFLTDHFHPFFHNGGRAPDLYYFPKGYLPLNQCLCKPSVVTIHDTIIQYDEDLYPRWRRSWEYAYWSRLLRHTLRHANRILTVSQNSKRQIEAFMERHDIPRKEITVTYEPCQYEDIPQPERNERQDYVIHLASREPHKRTAHLLKWWHDAEQAGHDLPTLHLVGNLPDESEPLLAKSRSIVKRPFLEDSALQDAYRKARALVLPSEIEGFGLPALEAYYLGTPVCYVKGTSVEEILSPATSKGGFNLDEPASLFAAMEQVMAMDPEEVRQCGLVLRETYAAEKVADRMLGVFEEVRQQQVRFTQ